MREGPSSLGCRHFARVCCAEERSTLPVIDIDGTRIGDSTRIIEELERRWPNPPLYPADPDERRRALELEDFFEHCAHEIRRVMFDPYLHHPELMAEATGTDRRRGATVTKAMSPVIFPVINRAVRLKYDDHPGDGGERAQARRGGDGPDRAGARTVRLPRRRLVQRRRPIGGRLLLSRSCARPSSPTTRSTLRATRRTSSAGATRSPSARRSSTCSRCTRATAARAPRWRPPSAPAPLPAWRARHPTPARSSRAPRSPPRRRRSASA